jgi:O-acetyl-ADP-ribose deacetylase (regulator of RNase III)
MISYVEGDLLCGGDDVIVHGCNCFHKMGAGVALQIARVYPGAYLADRQTSFKDASKLGTYSKWTGKNVNFPDKEITVVNAYTQFNFGISGKKIPFDYKAFGRVLPQIRGEFKEKSIGFPKIGCRLAGADWTIVEKMINDCFGEKEVRVYIYERKAK